MHCSWSLALLLVAAARLFAADSLPVAPKLRIEKEPAVELPPMIIEERVPVPWLYARVDDVEYLSRCSEATTRGYAEMRRSRMQWLRALFPEEFFLRLDVPVTTLLVSQKVKAGNTAEVIGEVVDLNKRQQNERGFVHATTAPNMALNDVDAISVFAYIDEGAFDRKKLTISSDYVRFHLEKRRPALPTWLREGMLGIYNDILFEEKPITLRPLKWHSAAQARAVMRDAGAPRVMIATGELFSEQPRFVLLEIGVAQRALLMRWALDPANGVRDAFWRFAARACEEPVTEPMFESIFGFGFSDLRDRLSDYLPVAVKGPLVIPLERVRPAAKIELRRAAPAEIARLRGEWERLCVPMVQRRYPDQAARYARQVKQTLERAYETGDRDPRTLAMHGLEEIDAGNVAGGREFLEAATAQNVVRPRAYYELARLRWSALGKGQAATHLFSAEELSPILDPLHAGLRQAPILPESVLLLADGWLRSKSAPPETETQELVRLGKLFTADPWICLRIARTLARHGQSTEAVTLLGGGFLHVHDNATKAQFAELYATIEKQR